MIFVLGSSLLILHVTFDFSRMTCAMQADTMEQSVECKAEDIQASGDDNVSGMSIISIESDNPPSVHSVNSFIDELDEYMVDVDGMNADDDELATGSETDSADMQPPILDVIQCNDVKHEESAEANEPELAENFSNVSESDGKEATNDASECDLSLRKTSSPSPENNEENCDTSSFHVAEISDKCDNGPEMASGDTTAVESGIFKLAIMKLFLHCPLSIHKFREVNFVTFREFSLLGLNFCVC